METVRTILVTGAAGYVGGTVVRRLLQEEETRVIGVDDCRLDHGAEGVRELLEGSPLEFHRIDVRRTEALAPLVERADSVVHLAAIVGDPACRRDPDLTRAVNLDASRRLIAECQRSELEQFVFVSTCSNYGISASDELVDEDAPLNPVSLYAETKVAVEEHLAELGDFPYTGLRLATVYGVAPRMRFDLTVNEFTIEAYTTKKLAIYGEQFWRPYVHVQDVAEAIATALRDPESSLMQVFNVGSSLENYTKKMLYELLVERVPELEVDWVSVDEDPRSYRVSFDRIHDTLGFRPRWRVPDGMDQVLRLASLGAFPDPTAPRFSN